MILCLPVLLTFKILTGKPSLLKETNSGLMPISVFEKLDILISELRDTYTPSIAAFPL